ncbi:MAG: ATP synthase F1 subunit delta [Bacteroidetes bacterium]|nr:ATP synthase F1 subunit delta [Bacteroidota bacterium]MBK8143524.1 ATP synthase F1 subunit delta [Bacteroidota bacterium]MBP6314464.1 ATP synthase F1 subunit delta [Chitinophagaceae bacterium]
MLNPRLAARYAKSLMDIALEHNKLDAIYKDMLGMQSLFSQSQDFVNLMKSPIVKADTKFSIVQAFTSGKVDAVTEGFIRLIIHKGREFFLEEIVGAFITQYKVHNKINEVKLTTAVALDEAIKTNLINKISAQFQGMTIDLNTEINEKLLGGFILEANSNVFDASILRDLNDIKKQFLKNEYIPDIR